ncbi:hypothetical protein ACJROX_09535 [Pseudalkalibacillus sp. A8]|uniref:hypothetical protein n=1 Tax=Pseudalkalibacillus sp. A8 TaxID=3382641 RepID=UPI0038B66AC2
MKKGLISVLSGLIIGGMLSYLFLEYNGWTYHEVTAEGTTFNTLHELDYNLLLNTGLVILCVGVGIYRFSERESPCRA